MGTLILPASGQVYLDANPHWTLAAPFVTNDAGFRGVGKISLVILNDLLAP